MYIISFTFLSAMCYGTFVLVNGSVAKARQEIWGNIDNFVKSYDFLESVINI